MNDTLFNTYYQKRYMVLAAIMLGGIMGPIDASIVNVTLPTIAHSFFVSVSTAQWVPMIYLLSISSLLLFYGRLGDIMGYKKLYLTGLAGFIIVSGLCGLSPTIYWLIVFRAIQGLAAGMMMSVSYAIITASFPPHERGKAMGINAISISAGLAIGPSMGGCITSLLHWRFVFLINIPIGIIGFLWGLRVIPNFKGQQSTIDIPGAVTAFIFLFSILLFVNRFQNQGFHCITVMMLLIALVSCIVFITIENNTPQPMLNLALFNNATFLFANVSALLNFMSQYVMVFATPFYLQRLLHNSSSSVGLIMTAFPLAVMAIAPFSGTLSDKVGTKALSCLGTGICAVALFLMSQLSVTSSSADIAWRLALFGFGTGIFQSPNNSAVMSSIPVHYLGIASGILATMRNAGMFLGIATAGIVLYITVPSYLLQKAYLESFEAINFLSGLHYAYIAGGILAGTAVITSLVRTKNQNEC